VRGGGKVVEGYELIESDANETGYTGVWKTKNGKFAAKFSGKHLGVFDTAEEAALTYAKAKADAKAAKEKAKKNSPLKKAKDKKTKLENELAQLEIQIAKLELEEAAEDEGEGEGEEPKEIN